MSSQFKGRIFRSVAAVALALAAGALTAEGAVINYGNVSGNNVQFLNITESSSTDLQPLYGPPSSNGDQINFDPLLFSSTASGGSADVTDGLITFVVDADPGFFIDGIVFTEFGDYTLAGAGDQNTSALVGQSIFVQVEEIDGVPLPLPILLQMNSVFHPSNGDYFLPAEGGAALPWFGLGGLDISAELAELQINGQATRVKVTSNNTLSTTSQPGTVAFINKKELNIAVGTEVIPEPAAISLLVIGAGWMLGRRRMS